MKDAILFCLFTGVISTLVLDIWVRIARLATGIEPTDWGMVGRWLRGIPTGHLVLDGSSPSPPTGGELALGWAFHYVIGIAYAVLILLIWGIGFVGAPTVWPVVFIGVVVSTLAGLMILMPGLGAGLMGARLPNQGAMIAYLIVAHSVYALGLYGAALWLSAKV
ncbi:DUF2938 family protein [Dyella sp. A6]|uniref:DUF2938 family protein n=1 Tax=Dyella aluminiiresistens TaxID=3069105 RepID=UPI002E7615FD|nr:DUF2938 family protein [Dyella sp. A6]